MRLLACIAYSCMTSASLLLCLFPPAYDKMRAKNISQLVNGSLFAANLNNSMAGKGCVQAGLARCTIAGACFACHIAGRTVHAGDQRGCNLLTRAGILGAPGWPPLNMTFPTLPSSKSLRPASTLCSNGGDGVPSLHVACECHPCSSCKAVVHPLILKPSLH